MTDRAKRLQILLGETLVGELRFEDESSTFRLHTEYIDMAARPVLGQVFEDDLRAEHRVRAGVPPWFANLLPEGPLRELIAERAGVHPSREFFLLGQVGADLPGAVIARPTSQADLIDTGTSSDGLESVAADGTVEDTDFEFKFSLAGVQLKFSVIPTDRGLTVPLHGEGGSVIAKLPDPRFEMVPENEWSMMTWARRSGLDVPDVALVKVEEIEGLPEGIQASKGNAFVVKRFDRDGGKRIHIEDFAQILNRFPTTRGKYGGANYETVGSLILNLSGRHDLEEFVRRLVAITAMGNGDAHLKNFSVIYRDRIHPQLSPVYDLVSTIDYVEHEETLALNLARSKSFNDVTLKSFRRMSRKLELESENELDEVVLSTVETLRNTWHEIRTDLPLATDVRDRVDERLATLPLFS